MRLVSVGNLEFYKVVVVDNPMKWANHSPIFDMNVTWFSLKHFPVNRTTARGGAILLYLTPPEDVENALILINTWVWHYRTQIIVRREDGTMQVGLVCSYGENVDLPEFGKTSLDSIPIRHMYQVLNTWGKEKLKCNEESEVLTNGELEVTKVGVVLFDKNPPRGWDWWDVDNIHSVFDLWGYPYRPRGFTISTDVVEIASKIREIALEKNKANWKIGELLVQADILNIRLAHLEKAINLPGLTPSYRWLWEILSVSKKYPPQTVDYTVSWSVYRSEFLKSKKNKGTTEDDEEDGG